MTHPGLRAALPAAMLSAGLAGGVERCAQRLIQHAARRAPPSLSARLEEEWLADLAARRGLSSLRLAIGCCWAMRIIAHEHTATAVPASACALGNKVMIAGTHHRRSASSHRTTAVLLVICLHAGLIYFLATGLVHRSGTLPPTVIQAGVTHELQPHYQPPPPAAPRLTPTRVEMPEPVFNFDLPVDAHPTTDLQVEQPQQPGSTSPPLPARRVPGGPGKGFPNTSDYYPPAAIRLGEKGLVALRVCVDGNGRLSADPTLAHSSGSARLDDGALRLAQAGSGHYRAATADGRPVDSCFPFLIRFDFKD
jgi:TonB family protein